MEKTLVTLLEHSAQQYEERTAIIFDDGHTTAKLSYKALTEECIQISDVLKGHGINHECVGIFGQMSIHTVPVLLGIMKSDCCFCPVSVDHPAYYLDKIISGLHIRAFLAVTDIVPTFVHLTNSLFDHFALPTIGGVSLLVKCQGDQPKDLNGFAYCITTSGTTGDPKIVKVPHQCIMPNITNISQMYGLTPEDVVCQVAPLTFDPSIVEMFTALCAGSSLLMTPDILKKSPKIFSAVIQAHNATVLQGTPTFIGNLGLKFLLGQKSSIRVLSFGGEVCPSPAVIMLNKHPNNKTKLFNIYGITEVSSWASCCVITDQHLDKYKEIPLGSALEDTLLELRNEENEVITTGIGHLFIGGGKRQCLINDETEFEKQKMRNSGDLVRIDDRGDMYYVGRDDDQIKRMGKRVNLIELEKVVVKVTGILQAAAVVSTDHNVFVIVKLDEMPSSKDVIAEVFATIDGHLPSYYKPEEVLIYEGKLPYSRHGKIDKRKLQQFLVNTKNTKTGTGASCSMSDMLKTEWKRVLNVSLDDIDFNSQFLQMGGDSFSALRLLDQMESHCSCILPHFLDILLSGTFGELKNYLDTRAHGSKRKHEENIELNNTISTRKHTKLAPDIGSDQVKPLPQRSDVTSCKLILCNKCESTKLDLNAVLAIRRCVKATLYGISLNGGCSTFAKSKWLAQYDRSETNVVNMKLEWTFNLGKCIDASPLAVQESDSCIVYLGSHSHTFMAVDVESGSMLWKATLGDRVESSAVLSWCAKYVIVGCYDGKLYVLDRKSGAIEWTFDTRDQVKCSPEVDPLTGIVFIGSHSHAVYGVDVEEKESLWCQNAIGGSIYSSPIIWLDPHQLYVASLSGKLLCLNPVTGDIVWSHALEKPIFSSPTADIKQVVVGCVDGTINSFSHRGEKLWQYRTNAPVFSSPCCAHDGNIAFGSHDNFVYCLSHSGQLVWKYKTNSPVFSSPYVISFCDNHIKKPSVVIACDTLGTIYLIDLKHGALLNKFSLQGEIFSSPIFLNDRIIVGCRNDEIYCISLF